MVYFPCTSPPALFVLSLPQQPLYFYHYQSKNFKMISHAPTENYSGNFFIESLYDQYPQQANQHHPPPGLCNQSPQGQHCPHRVRLLQAGRDTSDNKKAKIWRPRSAGGTSSTRPDLILMCGKVSKKNWLFGSLSG